ncbi:MAG: HAD family hydrolase [Anaerolineales bacterium]
MSPLLRAFLFDLGGTLIYPLAPWPPILEEADRALAYALAKGGWVEEASFIARWQQARRQYYDQRKHETRERTYRQLLVQLLPALPPLEREKAISQALEAFFSVTRPNWRADDQALPLLRFLQRQGFRLGMLSNAAEDGDVQWMVEHFGFRPFFDFVLTSAACGYRKPHPLPFRRALRHWNFLPSEVAMIGDLPEVDILGAKRVGMFGIWVRRHAPQDLIPATVSADWILDHLDELRQRFSL